MFTCEIRHFEVCTYNQSKLIFVKICMCPNILSIIIESEYSSVLVILHNHGNTSNIGLSKSSQFMWMFYFLNQHLKLVAMIEVIYVYTIFCCFKVHEVVVINCVFKVGICETFPFPYNLFSTNFPVSLKWSLSIIFWKLDLHLFAKKHACKAVNNPSKISTSILEEFLLFSIMYMAWCLTLYHNPSTVGHSQYIIILIYYQYHSNIAIFYCHLFVPNRDYSLQLCILDEKKINQEKERHFHMQWIMLKSMVFWKKWANIAIFIKIPFLFTEIPTACFSMVEDFNLPAPFLYSFCAI